MTIFPECTRAVSSIAEQIDRKMTLWTECCVFGEEAVEMRSAGSIDCKKCNASLSCEKYFVVLWQSSWKRLRIADDGKFAAWKQKNRYLFHAKRHSMTESHVHEDKARARNFSSSGKKALYSHQRRASCLAYLWTWKPGGTWGAWETLPLLRSLATSDGRLMTSYEYPTAVNVQNCDKYRGDIWGWTRLRWEKPLPISSSTSFSSRLYLMPVFVTN